MTPLAVTALRVEHRDGLGIGVREPRLSWRTVTAIPGWEQAAYQLALDGDPAREATEWVESPESVLVPWPSTPLGARARRAVRVRVRGADGTESAWSEPLTLEAGLLEPSDWTARFVSPGLSDEGPCPILRREFVTVGSIERARLYATALGVYELELNGTRVGDHVLSPGWSSYDHRLRIETFDVTDLVQPGANVIGAYLAGGWYLERYGFGGDTRRVYGDDLALLAQLEVTYADGRAEIVGTDATWRAAPGPILSSGIYAGESYDARRLPKAWSRCGFDDAGWTNARVIDRDLTILVARTGPPVRRIEALAPVETRLTESGRPILDFGQNLVGRLRLRVSGPEGTKIRLRHAEVLEDGELCTAPLRGAAATDTYVLAGTGEETWEPRFTFHGFRYAEIDGWPGPLEPGAVEAAVCHSDMERTGWFECSNELVSRLHENVVWGMRGNFLDVPTDCPQRDERMGWTGDINVFAPTAAFLYDCAGFLASWLADLAVEQEPTGAIPFVVPGVLQWNVATAVWGDAAVCVPWVVYERFGDAGLLATQYPSMRRFVELVVDLAGPRRLWDSGFQFGDWLDPAAPADNPAGGRTDPHLVASASFVHSLDVMARAAAVVGAKDDVVRYESLAREVRDAFAREYTSVNGRVVSDSQTAYALAICYALVPDEAARRHAGDRLAALVAAGGNRIGTGFVGTPIVCDALCATGHASTAYELLLETECPSWIYAVEHGATTIWERWDSLMPDGRVNPDGMTSFNHYALGAIADWLHRKVGGLAPAAPGYRRLSIAPVADGGLEWARTRHLTPYGMAEVSWRLDGDELEVTATVPPGTTATVRLPDAGQSPFDVGPGTATWRCPRPPAAAAS